VVKIRIIRFVGHETGIGMGNKVGCNCILFSDQHEGVKSKDIPQQAEVAVGVPGRLRPRIITTFGTTRVVGRQPYAPASFTPGEIPGTHFQRLSRPQGTWFCRKEPRKKSPMTPPGKHEGVTSIIIAATFENYSVIRYMNLKRKILKCNAVNAFYLIINKIGWLL
jgi:hypothetical protein